jgi:two-component system OmpR family sensor kinase
VNVSVRVRLLVTFLVVAIGAALALGLYSLSELEGYALRKLEERLWAEARVVSAIAGELLEARVGWSRSRFGSSPGSEASLLGSPLAKIGSGLSSRIVVVDSIGRVVAVSSDPEELETSQADRPEVAAALAGHEKAATRIGAGGRVALYTAVPIRASGKVVGAIYATATTFSIVTLVRDYRNKLALLVLLYLLATIVVTELLARWLSRPLVELEAGVTAFAKGDHSARVRPSGARETRAVAAGFNAMADEVEHVVAELKEEERRKSRFVSDVSHELRTPLTAIRGAAETLMQQDVPESDRRGFLGSIVSESDRLARLAGDLMTLERIEGGTGELRMGLVGLDDVTRRAIEALVPLSAERRVSVTLEGSAARVLGDADRLQQVVANLVDNATRVTTTGGSVDVRLGGSESEALLEVADRGPGVPAGVDVFERFARAEPSRDRSTGGAGLGLAIARAIVVAHGGTIEARDREGGGAVFSVRLPTVREA